MKIFASYSYKDEKAMLITEKISFHLKIEIMHNKFFMCGENILEGTLNAIQSSDIFISFISKNDPNTMFELGYAMGAKKNIILITELQEVPEFASSFIFIKKHSNIYDIISLVEKNATNLSKKIHRKNFSTVEKEIENIIKSKNLNKLKDDQIFFKNKKPIDFIVLTENDSKIGIEIASFRKNSNISLNKIKEFSNLIDSLNLNLGLLVLPEDPGYPIIEFANTINKKIKIIYGDHIKSKIEHNLQK